MKLGVLGWIMSDLSDIDENKILWLPTHGFQGTGVHLTVEADQVPDERLYNLKDRLADQAIDLVQFWAPYPCIICEDDSVRKEGIAKAQAGVVAAVKAGALTAGIRPTSLNPRGDWWPHAGNYSQETEDRLVDSLIEIAKVAEDHDIDIVLECHVTTTLHSPERIVQIIERTGSERIKTNLDPVNFMGDFHTAFNQHEMFDRLFNIMGSYVATAHIKDFYMEDRFVIHIAETVPGLGMLDIDTVLLRYQALLPDGYACVEHLPPSLLIQAGQYVSERIHALNIPVG